MGKDKKGAGKPNNDYIDSNIHIGEAEFIDGKIEFTGHKHPALHEAKDAVKESSDALIKASKDNEKLKASLKNVMHHNQVSSPDEMDIAIKAAHYDKETLTTEGLNQELVSDIRKAINKHHPDELKAVEEANAKLNGVVSEIREAQLSFLEREGFDLAKVKGVNEENMEEAEKALAALKKETKTTIDEIEELAKEGSKVGGFVKNLSHKNIGRNIGGEAWKESASKAGFKTAGAVVGVGAMLDGLARGNRTSPNGEIERRGTLGRTAEFVIGAALASGSVLRHR